MQNETYLNFLDDLNHKERSLFLYYFVLKIPQNEIAQRLHLNIRYVNKTCKQLMKEKEILPLREQIMQAFLLDG